LGATQLALDLDADTHKVALFTNSVTPNYDTDTAYGVAPYNANEVTGTGYTAGGVTLTTATLTSAAGVLKFDGDDVSWPSSTISGARCALVYANALAGKNAILLVDFGADYATQNGALSIIWSANGLMQIDLVP
jgi:hypothetical protein